MTTDTPSSFCFFCGATGPIVCDKPECQQHDAEYRAELAADYRRQVRAGVWAALRQRCKCDLDSPRRRVIRWWYTLKLLLCVLLRLEYHGQECFPSRVEVGCYHSAKLYAGWEADWIRVGRGVLSGWWFDLHHDGDWEM